MNGKRVLAATIYSSVLVLGMSGSAMAQSNTQTQGTTGGTATQQGSKTAQQGDTATQQQGSKTAQQGDAATQQGSEMAQGGDAVQDGAAPAMDSGLVGMEVRNGQDEVIGEVANVLVTEDGRIDAILLGAGGVLGIGENQYVVPWDRLQVTPGQGYVMVNVPADKIEAEFSLFEPEPKQQAAPASGTGTGTGMGGGAGTGMGAPSPTQQSPTQQMQQGAGGGGGAY